MSIILYSGLAGAGKSYGAVENVILPALRDGRTVVHNLPLVPEKCLALGGGGVLVPLPEKATPQDIVRFGLENPGAVFVFDEFWRYWANGLKAHLVPEDQKEFFAMHRHRVGADGRSSEIALLTQDAAQIANFVRELVEQTFRMTKLSMVGMNTRFRVDVYEGAITGAKPPVSKRLRSFNGKYKPEIYACYRSHTQSETGAAGLEVRADRRGNIFHGWRFRIAVIALLSVPWFLWHTYSVFTGLGHRGDKAVSTRVVPERSDGTARVEVGRPAGRAVPVIRDAPESQVWKLVGRIDPGNGPAYFLIRAGSKSRKIPTSACSRPDVAGWVCKVAGELVAEWTGPQDPGPGVVASFVSDSVPVAR